MKNTGDQENEYPCGSISMHHMCLSFSKNKKYINLKFVRLDFKASLSDINHSRFLYDPPPRIMEIKAKISKWDLLKLKSFCTAKETINKRNPQTGRKYLQMM